MAKCGWIECEEWKCLTEKARWKQRKKSARGRCEEHWNKVSTAIDGILHQLLYIKVFQTFVQLLYNDIKWLDEATVWWKLRVSFRNNNVSGVKLHRQSKLQCICK